MLVKEMIYFKRLALEYHYVYVDPPLVSMDPKDNRGQLQKSVLESTNQAV